MHVALVAELAVFQLAWPMAVARAEETPADALAQEQTAAGANDKAADDADSADTAESKPEENTDKKENADEADNIAGPKENPEDLWKTCKLDNLFDKFEDEKDCDECRKKTSCGEIEICLKAKIEIENDADIDNEIETAANTGENEIDLAKPRPVRDRAENSAAESPGTADVADSGAQPEATVENSLAENSAANTESGEQNQTAEIQDRSERERDTDKRRDDTDDSAANAEESPENSSASLAESRRAEIQTGDAVAVADVVNEVNTNIIGENGVETVENIYGDYEGDINLLDSFNSLLENAENVNDGNSSAFGAMEISIENEADIENDVVTEANTGKNEIDNEAEAGDSSVTTGDAIAVANVANIVNTNIIGNNFLFTVINIFGNWVGDLIVPGEGLLTVPQTGQPANFIVDVQNDTNIENNIETAATTGGNEIETEGGSASVETGDAYADSMVVNQVGSTTVANNWFFLAVNNMGNWVGNVLNWNGEKNGYDAVFSFDFDEEDDLDGTGMANWFTKIFIKNEADIENNVETAANTGGNEIESEGGDANIKTGNGYAFSKIYNLVNNNFIGSNWMFAVVNIFGSWQGDVEFAYPDLSVALADSVEKVKKGDSYFYNLTVKNNGRADSQNIRVGLSLPENVGYLGGAGENAGKDGNDYSWTLPGLKAGEEKTFQVAVSVSESLPDETEYLESRAAVATRTKEVELGNNVASDQTGVYALAVDGGSGGNDTGDSSEQKENGSGNEGSLQNEAISSLTLSRSVSKTKIEVGGITKHTIVAANNGNTALKDVVISDTIRNKKGDAGEYSWKVEKLDPGKKAVITYKLMVNSGAPTGDYRHKSVARGYDENENEVKSNEAGIKVAVSGSGDEDANYYGAYYTYYYPESPVTIFEEGAELIPAAVAAGEIPGEGSVLGEWTNASGVCRDLPWWGWLFAGIIYLTVVHWSLARQRKIIKPVKS